MPICGTVSQISPPIRIVLVAAIGLIAAWMLFLRPKTEADPRSDAGARHGPGRDRAVEGRRQGQGRRAPPRRRATRRCRRRRAMTPRRPTARQGRLEGDRPARWSAAACSPLEPLTAEQTKGLPKEIVRALDNRQVLVVGVFDTKEKRWARMAADDRRVRRELVEGQPLRRQGRRGRRATLGKLSSLNAVIGDLGVTQTPSVVVVDRNRKAVVLTGFVERNAINQAIADARRNIDRASASRSPTSASSTRPARTSSSALDRFDAPDDARQHQARRCAASSRLDGHLRAPASPR